MQIKDNDRATFFGQYLQSLWGGKVTTFWYTKVNVKHFSKKQSGGGAKNILAPNNLSVNSRSLNLYILICSLKDKLTR